MGSCRWGRSSGAKRAIGPFVAHLSGRTVDNSHCLGAIYNRKQREGRKESFKEVIQSQCCKEAADDASDHAGWYLRV